MTTFHTDDDLAGAAQFDEGSELALGTTFTVDTAGTASFRWRWPFESSVGTPTVRVWNEAGGLVAGPLPFATATPGAWNLAGAASPVALAAGTYRVAVNSSKYPARAGFYTAGPITRGHITGVRGVFGASPTSAPSTPSTLTYFVDIDFTPDGETEPEPEPTPDPLVEEPRVGEALHLGRVMSEVATVMSRITGLRMFDYPAASVTAPAGYVSYPASIDYTQAYQRGDVTFTDLPIVLLAGKPTERSSRDTVAEWVASDGPHSVMAALEEWDWQTCDDLTVTSAEFDVEANAGVPYLAAMFKATVIGPGKD